MAVAIVACPNHPAREAIGICVKCRARVCAECSTKVDGINHCAPCLAALAPPAATSRPRTPWSSVRAAIAGSASLIVLAMLTWALLEAALP